MAKKPPEQPMKVPPLRKKNRSLKDLGPNSLGAALVWDRLVREMTPQTIEADQPDEQPR